MKVILLDEVRNLGEPGTVVDVADGYARNFLLPRKLAVEASKGAVKSLEHHKRVAARRLNRLTKDSSALADALTQTRLVLTAKAGEAGKMYGSVTAGQIADELDRQHGLVVDKRKIHLEEPIKVLGEHLVQIHLHRDVRAQLTVEVVAEAEEEQEPPEEEKAGADGAQAAGEAAEASPGGGAPEAESEQGAAQADAEGQPA
jgi:large subunit ribosomal protein L9